jgi:hypothetical protein
MISSIDGRAASDPVSGRSSATADHSTPDDRSGEVFQFDHSTALEVANHAGHTSSQQ